MARQNVKGYQTKADGHYATLKVAGKSYVSPRFPLDMDPERLQLEVEAWRSKKRLEIKRAEGVQSAAPKGSLARDIKRFLTSLPEGRRKTDFSAWLKRWAECPLGVKNRFIITREEVRDQSRRG